MKIYLDYVFLINFIFDFILLLGVSIVLKRNAKIKRILFGSLFGALSTFMLFIPMSSFLFFILKILSGIIMLIITFNFKDVKYTFMNLVYLMILSIIMGGSLYLINIEVGYENVGMVFFTNGEGINIFILILVAILVLLIYVRVEKKYKNDITCYYEVTLFKKDSIYNLIGFIDTGNDLYDPYFNKPVLILNSDYSYLFDDSEKFILVPFNTINSTGVMKCFYVDKIIIKNKGIYCNCLIGLSKEKFNISGVDIILHKDLKEEKL